MHFNLSKCFQFINEVLNFFIFQPVAQGNYLSYTAGEIYSWSLILSYFKLLYNKKVYTHMRL